MSEKDIVKRSNVEIPKNMGYNSIDNKARKEEKGSPTFLIIVVITQILLGGLIWFGAYHLLTWS